MIIAAGIWSAILVIVTITFHVCGIAWIALVVPRLWKKDVSGRRTFLNTIPGAVSIIIVNALVLAVLHLVEALMWAVVYFRLGALNSIADAFLYSLGAMSGGGAGLAVQKPWRFMGAIESFDGLLLFGISIAFLFSVMTVLWRQAELNQQFKH